MACLTLLTEGYLDVCLPPMLAYLGMANADKTTSRRRVRHLPWRGSSLPNKKPATETRTRTDRPSGKKCNEKSQSENCLARARMTIPMCSYTDTSCKPRASNQFYKLVLPSGKANMNVENYPFMIFLKTNMVHPLDLWFVLRAVDGSRKHPSQVLQ